MMARFFFEARVTAMRVLMISDVYFPRVNGVSTPIQTFARELVAAGCAVTLIAPDYGHAAAAPFEVIRIPSLYLPVDPEDRILRVRALRRQRPNLAWRGFDLLHIHTPFVSHYSGLALARRLGIPAVESYHTFFEYYLDNCSSATWIGTAPWRTVTVPGMPSSSPPAPRPRAWCSWRRWRSASRWSPPPSWGPGRCWRRAAAA
jgi:Glycosyltransferase Family 4